MELGLVWDGLDGLERVEVRPKIMTARIQASRNGIVTRGTVGHEFDIRAPANISTRHSPLTSPRSSLISWEDMIPMVLALQLWERAIILP